MSFDAEHIYNEVLAAGNDWADKKSAFEALDDNTKSVLADITGRYMDGTGRNVGDRISRTEAERYALASKDYKEHLADVSKARKEWLIAQVRYDCLKMLSELRRSQESSRRAEMGMR